MIAVELLGIRSLSFAVGSYLSIGTTAAIFCGGVVKWLAERGQKQTEEGEASPGALYACGLIAAGGIVGLLAIGVSLAARRQGVLPKDAIKFGLGLPFHDAATWSGVIAFAAARVLALLLRAEAAGRAEPPKENLPGTPDARVEQ